MESAEWDEEAKTISLHDLDEPRIGETVASREQLVSYLEGIASSAFYAYCSKDDDGDWISTCDENGIVEDVLSAYEDRLDKFFSGMDVDSPTT